MRAMYPPQWPHEPHPAGRVRVSGSRSSPLVDTLRVRPLLGRHEAELGSHEVTDLD